MLFFPLLSLSKLCHLILHLVNIFVRYKTQIFPWCFNFISFYVYGCFASCLQVLAEARKRHLTHRNWRLRQLWAAKWVLGIEPQFSGEQLVLLTTEKSLAPFSYFSVDLPCILLKHWRLYIHWQFLCLNWIIIVHFHMFHMLNVLLTPLFVIHMRLQ